VKKYVMLVDASKCTQCHNCVLACKDEHFGNDFPPYTLGIQELGEAWINMHIEERGSGSKVRMTSWPELCRHCDDPECVKASPAAYKREDGIVLIDPVKAKGDKALPGVCPHHAIAWNGERDIPQKCTFCAHLLDAGEPVPRCVEACPTGALIFGDINDPDSEAARVIRQDPEQFSDCRGAVRYFGRPGRFIAGSVYLSEAEVAEGAEVRLLEDNQLVARTRTNGFGDFRFDKLPDDRQYQIKISLEGFGPLLLAADTAKDVCWEEITLG